MGCRFYRSGSSGLLDAFFVFGCPIANLCQELVVVGIGVDIDISSKKGLTELLSQYDVIERTKSKYLFKELGLVVEKDLSEFRFFEQSLLKFWVNLHRPITSW